MTLFEILISKPRVSVNFLNLVRECTGPYTRDCHGRAGPNPPSNLDVTITDDVSTHMQREHELVVEQGKPPRLAA